MKIHHLLLTLALLGVMRLFFISCSTDQKTPEEKTKILFAKLDTTVMLSHQIVQKAERIVNRTDTTALMLRFLDSNLTYYLKARDFDSKKMEYEILYLRTGKEKYRLLASKYDAKRVYYAKICNRWNDSLHQFNIKK